METQNRAGLCGGNLSETHRTHVEMRKDAVEETDRFHGLIS